MLTGELSYLDGARFIRESCWAAQLEDDSDIAAFVLIESETDHLPLGPSRKDWSPAALEDKEFDLRRAEDWARGTAEEEVKNLVRRFGGLVDRAGLVTDLDLVHRRAFFDSYAENVATASPALVQFGVRLTCPCCGYPTLRGRAQFEVCFLCWWEDDGQDDDTADNIQGGPNAGHSLSQARDNFVTYGVMYEPERDRRIGGVESDLERDTKSRILGAFDEMMRTLASEHDRLWAQIRAGEKELNRLLKNRVASAGTSDK